MEEEKIIESVEQIDTSGKIWRIDLTKNSMYLIDTEEEFAIIEIKTAAFNVYYQLRDLVTKSSTEEIFEYIDYKVDSSEKIRSFIGDTPPGLIFYN